MRLARLYYFKVFNAQLILDQIAQQAHLRLAVLWTLFITHNKVSKTLAVLVEYQFKWAPVAIIGTSYVVPHNHKTFSLFELLWKWGNRKMSAFLIFFVWIVLHILCKVLWKQIMWCIILNLMCQIWKVNNSSRTETWSTNKQLNHASSSMILWSSSMIFQHDIISQHITIKQ